MGKKVSIWCSTYNHEPYIRDALDGFIKQKTNFDYDVVIYDDASVDDTADILKEYANKYADIIKLYLSDHNRWREKDRRLFFYRIKQDALKGKYVAYCEGDDYWTDENKLQLQVDYMDAHPECMMYIHNAEWKDYSNNTTRMGNPFDVSGENDVTLEDLIEQKKGHPPTASFLFRRELLEKDFFFFDAPVGDYTLLLCAATYGRVHYNSKPMSVYRYKTPGSYSDTYQKDPVFYSYYSLGFICFLYQYNQYTEKRYEKNLWRKVDPLQMAIKQICNENEVDVFELYEECNRNGMYLSEDCKKILPKLHLVLEDQKETNLPSGLIDFVSQYEHIVVMGTGCYAEILTKQLVSHGISFDGYAVSDISNANRICNGKTVWSLSELPFDLDRTGILIGILAVDKQDIMASIKRARVLHYFMPFERNIFD